MFERSEFWSPRKTSAEQGYPKGKERGALSLLPLFGQTKKEGRRLGFAHPWAVERGRQPINFCSLVRVEATVIGKRFLYGTI